MSWHFVNTDVRALLIPKGHALALIRVHSFSCKSKQWINAHHLWQLFHETQSHSPVMRQKLHDNQVGSACTCRPAPRAEHAKFSFPWRSVAKSWVQFIVAQFFPVFRPIRFRWTQLCVQNTMYVIHETIQFITLCQWICCDTKKDARSSTLAFFFGKMAQTEVYRKCSENVQKRKTLATRDLATSFSDLLLSRCFCAKFALVTCVQNSIGDLL